MVVEIIPKFTYVVVMLMDLLVNSFSRLFMSRRFDDLAGNSWINSVQD